MTWMIHWSLMKQWWKPITLVLLLAAAVGYHSVYVYSLKEEIDQLGDTLKMVQTENVALEAQNRVFNAVVDRQNAAVDAMFEAGKLREERLAETLSMPPKVVYRDKIVEVPSIASGPCEQVMMDIAKYVAVVKE